MRFLNEDDDWIEPFRRRLYPRLHPYLEPFGGYAVGRVGENQYSLTVPAGEETLEEVLYERGWERNPVACYKTHDDGRKSSGSWRLRAINDEYGLLDDDCCQLHITLFDNHDVDEYVDVYCHKEYDWQVSPLKHLRGEDFDPIAGQVRAREFIRDYTYLDWYHKEDLE